MNDWDSLRIAAAMERANDMRYASMTNDARHRYWKIKQARQERIKGCATALLVGLLIVAIGALVCVAAAVLALHVA